MKETNKELYGGRTILTATVCLQFKTYVVEIVLSHLPKIDPCPFRKQIE